MDTFPIAAPPNFSVNDVFYYIVSLLVHISTFFYKAMDKARYTAVPQIIRAEILFTLLSHFPCWSNSPNIRPAKANNIKIRDRQKPGQPPVNLFV
ncbi:hypothetical protein Dred_0619 [Desulforamulus reducens MI-1]|uniref:Uncharacterized protein n=1 Tax=Desulforamulus reducens (strain ATCC BAA-1160 / DSM 100696 / MI-1) TaxID=349161 RepID=A4J256_DESRM|nr:hypothetical protein Dred_0619 [Desulforamulus reducens MI-1]